MKGAIMKGRIVRQFTVTAMAVILTALVSIATPATAVLAQDDGPAKDDNARISATSGPARYRVEFATSWSAATHPHPGDNFPTSSAHFSPLIGAVHNGDISFWAADRLASAGIEQMAETGATGLLRGEITVAIGDGTTLAEINGNGVPVSPGGTVIDEIEVTADFPRVTLVTMIAPSPDWFVGISDESLLDEKGRWVAEKTFTLYPYDAGTDSGADYISSDADTDPAELIHSLRDQSPFSDAPIGTFTFTRMDKPQSMIYLPMVCKK